jgi:hypothetical protein
LNRATPSHPRIPVPVKDSLIATTALVHGLVVVTRNRADLEKAGVEVLDSFPG